MFAMSTLGFDNYVEPLKLYLQKYREATKGDKQGAEGFEDLGEDVLSKLKLTVNFSAVSNLELRYWSPFCHRVNFKIMPNHEGSPINTTISIFVIVSLVIC